MLAHEIVPNVYLLNLGGVNGYMIRCGADLTLIDTGNPGSAERILAAARELRGTIRNILVTHCHPDHAGSVAALATSIGAPVWMHRLDAALVRQGIAVRGATHPTPGLMNAIIYRLAIERAPRTVEPYAVEHDISDGDVIPVADGIRAIHVPGHSAGQLALLLPRDGSVLFAADAAINIPRLALFPAYEDLTEAKRSLVKLAALHFETVAFGHGRPIVGDASERWRRKWAACPIPELAVS